MIKNELPETNLTLKDFYYDLPEDRIAQTPIYPRDSSKLMVINRNNNTINHKIFRDIIDYLSPGDVLVINDTKVIPARIIGTRIKKMTSTGLLEDSSSKSPVELLLLKQKENDIWEALAGPGKRAKPGDTLSFGDGVLIAHIIDIGKDGCRIVKFECDKTRCQSVYDALHLVGTMPLPPYITKKLEDQDRYQTVYAKEEGSAAAPTAGLHFTPELLEKIKEKGVKIAPVLLHVGLGTFRPVKEEKIADHEMHSEYIEVTEESAKIINEAKASGHKVIAVGTTSCRTIESATDENGIIHTVNTDTGIFIYPGYKFKITDALITNFHLPESTLLMLVSALAGREKMLNAYKIAIDNNYRFFSFGDAMIIL